MAAKKSRAQRMWRSLSGSSGVHTALMFTLWAASRWVKAVSWKVSVALARATSTGRLQELSE